MSRWTIVAHRWCSGMAPNNGFEATRVARSSSHTRWARFHGVDFRMKLAATLLACGVLLASAWGLSGCAEDARPCAEGAIAPLVTYAAAPDYPAIARAAHIEGTVLVRVHVNTEGRVAAAEIIDGPETLYAAALAASYDYLFSPARVACVAVEQDVNLPITFRL